MNWNNLVRSTLFVIIGVVALACSATEETTLSAESRHEERRRRMVDEQLKARAITDPRVLEVMGRVPRHRFVPEDLRELAYADNALPIAEGQTISQPYIVALMTQLARPGPTDRALDIGTGSGYQAAVLAELVQSVHSIEIHRALADAARARLKELGYENVTVRHGDGYRGWPEHAPFDAIIVAAAASRIPPALLEQLAVGGRLVLPVGDATQDLIVIEKRPDGSFTRQTVAPVIFVPLTGEARNPPEEP